MPIIESLTFNLAPIVAKSILALWLRSEDFAADATSDTIELIRSATSDVRAQQRIKREFEEIGERVVDSFIPFLEIEAQHLSGETQNLIVEAVSDTLKKVPIIDTAVLAQYNLDSVSIFEHLRNTYDLDAYAFSNDEQVIYERMLKSSCEYIVNIASGLPFYSERVLAEILKREDQIIDSVIQVIDELKKIYENSIHSNPILAFARLETDYLNGVLSQLGKLELFGIRKSVIGRRYALDSAFVTLRVQQSSQNPQLRNDGIQHMPMLNIPQALNSNRIIVRGEAGSGKTTLLQWIAIRAATDTFPSEMHNWKGCIPFLIRLRQFESSSLPEATDFIRNINPLLLGNHTEQWILERLRSANSIILIDGVDEVPSDQNALFINWLERLIDLYPNVKYVITSRNYAIQQEWYENSGFMIFDIQRMDSQMILHFIDRWHEAAKLEVSSLDEITEIENRAQLIKERAIADQSLLNLITNPLICAIICALSQETEDELPIRRISLYEEACKILVDIRDRQRGIRAGQLALNDKQISLGLEQRFKILQSLAESMLQNGDKEISEFKAKNIIARCLPSLQINADDTTVNSIYLLLVQRSGIVREPVSERMDFTHTTFQDYFAAKQIIDHDDIGLLVNRAEDEGFRNLFVFAGGLANQNQQKELIERLLNRGQKQFPNGGWYYLLALAATTEMLALSPSLRNEVEICMKNVKLPENETEAVAWATGGHASVPFLRKDVSSGNEYGCIRALSYIGGDEAFNALEEYLAIEDREIQISLSNAWGSFDIKEFVERILMKLSHIQVDGSSKEIMTELKRRIHHFDDSLYTLHISNSNDSDLINRATNLTSLSISGWSALNLDSLEDLARLEELSISFSHSLDDTTSLTDLSALKILRIILCPVIKSLDSISELRQLESLHLSHCYELQTLGSLSELSKLRRIDLHTLPNFKDFNGLAELSWLEDLRMFDCSQSDDYSFLSALESVTYLEIGGGAMKTLSYIPEMKNLESLWILAGTRLTDASFISQLSKLRSLRFVEPVDESVAEFLDSLSSVEVEFPSEVK